MEPSMLAFQRCLMLYMRDVTEKADFMYSNFTDSK